MNHWKPNTTPEILKLRAGLLNRARQFFQENNFLEVDTPVLSQSTTPDPNIESFSTQFNNTQYFLHTSPEFPMKRLLAAGSGAIYQVCKVFRQGELGRNHNPEFTMIEWYQPGLDYHALMKQVDALVRTLLQDKITLQETVFYSYQQVFKKYLNIDPFNSSIDELQAVIKQQAIQFNNEAQLSKDALLDLLISYVIQPVLPKDSPVFIYDYPASQAALANIRDEQGEKIAERFELFINGIELANGYQELLDAKEQQLRFENENKTRLEAGQQTIPVDKNLIAALQAGMPEVSGVALGFDRLMMLATGAGSINEVISFSTDKA